MRVLAIGAHPDDLELLCAGTLAKMAKRGDQVYMAHLTVGDKGGRDNPEELARIRRAEAAAAAELIGATPLFGFTGDLELYTERECRDLVMDFIREARPDLIIAPDPNCYHPDHRIASRLVFDAAYCSTIPNYPSPRGLEAYSYRAPIYYMDTVNGVGFMPEEYVDISEFWEVKRKMIECHKSQLQWMQGHRAADMVKMAETLARFRGLQCQVEYAEAFRRENVWGRIRPERLLP